MARRRSTRKTTPDDGTLNGDRKDKCPGTSSRTGLPCRQPKGYKTDHPGYGYCAFCGGATPNGNKHAMKEMARHAVATYGLPRDVDPHTALLEEVHRTAGHVAYLGERVASLTDADLVWGTMKSERSVTVPAANGSPRSGDPRTRGVSDPSGAPQKDDTVAPVAYTADVKTVEAAELSIWVRMYQAERKQLVEVCKTAIACGITERMVKIAEEQSRMFVLGQTLILRRLGLDPQDSAVRAVVRDVMNMLATGDMKQLGTGEVIDV